MNRILAFLFAVVSLPLMAANPAFTDFNSSQFSTSGNKISIKASPVITNVIPSFWSTNTSSSGSITNTYNGPVGIGTANPTGRLDVASSAGIKLITVTDNNLASVSVAPITIANYGGDAGYGLRNQIPMGIARESMWLGINSNQRRISLGDYVPAFDVPGFDPPMLDLEFGGEGFTFHVTPAGYGYHQDGNDPRSIFQLRPDSNPQNTGSIIGGVGQVVMMSGMFAENTVANPSIYWSSWGDVNTPFIYFRKTGTNDTWGAMKYQSATDDPQGLIEARYKSNGTFGSPTATGASNTIYDVVSRAFYGGTNWGTTSEIIMGTENAASSVSTPGFFAVKTTPSGSITPVERLRVSSDGNVKIVAGSGVKMLEAQDTRSGVTAGDLTVGNNVGVGGYVTVGRVSSNGSDATVFDVRNRVNGEVFLVDARSEESYFLGKLGVGTATPGTPLHVVGDAQVSSGVIYGNAAGVSNAVTLIPSGCVQITTNADGRTFTISLSGGGADVLTNNRTIATTFLANLTDTQNGVSGILQSNKLSVAVITNQVSSTSAITIQAGSTSTAVFTNGNVGIGTAGPLNKLDVSGGAVFGSGYAGIATAPTGGLLIEGNVGIGTTSAGQKLTVEKSNSGGDVVDLDLSNAGSAATSNSVSIQFRPAFSYSPTVKISAIIENNAIGKFGGVAISTFGTSGSLTEKVRIESDGSVGIGLVAPTNKLQVIGAIQATTTLFANMASLTNGIVGVVNASTASAGNVGEVVSSAIASGSAVSLTTATAANVTSISLTAGDWDVSGNINIAGASATYTQGVGGTSTTSATVPTDGTEVYSGAQFTLLSVTDGLTVPRKVVNVSSTTTVYLVAKATFSAGTMTAFGSMTARRVR